MSGFVGVASQRAAMGIRPLGVIDLLETIDSGTPSQIAQEVPDELLQAIVPEMMGRFMYAATHDRDVLVFEQACGVLKRRVRQLAQSNMSNRRLHAEVMELRKAVEEHMVDWQAGRAVLQNALVWAY